jgi:hypothetical protein
MTTSATAEPMPSRGRTDAAPRVLARLRDRVEASDALLFFYLLVFARQFLWIVSDNALAWALSAPLAAAALFFYVRTQPFPRERAGREFWLLVVLPLVVFYLLRLPFPDLSYDVLNYRLLHAERSLRGTLFVPGDYFPTPAPYNPAPDTLTGLFRLALGYRLGTIVSLLALVWAARVCEQLLRPFVTRGRVRAACVLLVVLAEHLLFEVNEYMVDLLALPLLLEATRLALRADEAESKRTLLVHAALLLGLGMGLKMTNAASVLPVLLLCAYKALAGPRRLKLKELPPTIALTAAAFAAPLLPFTVYLWRLTANPFFPLANTFFKSAYWPTDGGWDARWGPKGLWETLAWPVLATFEPARHSELVVYSGRITLGFVVALCGVALLRRERRVRVLCLLVTFGGLAWSAGGMGYSRYGLYLELVSGVTVVAVVSALLKMRVRRNDSALDSDDAASASDGPAPAPSGAEAAQVSFSWKTAVAALFAVALCAQAAAACWYALHYEWSMRPTALSNWGAYRYEARFVLRDRRLRDFLSEEAHAEFDGVRGWVESGVKSNGFEALINPDVPIITASHPEYFATRTARANFIRTVESGPARMLSLCQPEDLPQAKEYVKSRGLVVGRVRPLQVPFFSQRGRIGMMLVEVSTPEGEEGRASLERFWKAAAFPDQDYRAEINVANPPASLRAGERLELRFRVRNAGGSAWPARGDSRGAYQVNAGDRWLDPGTGRVDNDLDGRASLAEDLRPGAEAELQLTVTAPRAPGDYVLELDMVHEGVTFFREKGSRTLRMNVRVGP